MTSLAALVAFACAVAPAEDLARVPTSVHSAESDSDATANTAVDAAKPAALAPDLLAGIRPAHPTVSSAPALPADAPVAPRRNFLVPVLESAGLQFGMLAFNNLATRMDFALISWSTIASHFDGTAGWTFDTDYFVTNQLGHPYQGSLSFMAARSSGVPFWLSGLYPFGASLAWEMFFERDPPSINDQITTSLGGTFLGEALYRTYLALTDDRDGPPSWVARVVAWLLSPPAAINDALFGGQTRPEDLDTNARWSVSVAPGMTLQTRLKERDSAGVVQEKWVRGVQPALHLELAYAEPLSEDRLRFHPFSQFDLLFDGTALATPTANLFIRGLLSGRSFGEEAAQTPRVHGVYGFYALYDYGGNDVVRVSSTGMGFGTSVDLELSRRWALRTSATLALLPFAAAGSLGLNTDEVRDYHIGMGTETLGSIELVGRGIGSLGITGRSWYVAGVYAEPRGGFESVSYLDLRFRVNVTRRILAEADLPVAVRLFGFGGTTSSIVGASPRLSLCFSTDDLDPRF